MTVDQIQREERRLCLLRVLYESSRALRGKSARFIMDRLGHPTDWDGFLRTVEFLRSLHLIHAFPPDIQTDMSNVEEAKFVAMLQSASFDSPEATTFMLKITPRGKDVVEGNETVNGVARP